MSNNTNVKLVTLTDARIIRLPEVVKLVGLKTSTIYAAMREGRFPASVKLGPRLVGWRAGDISRWLAERPSARQASGIESGDAFSDAASLREAVKRIGELTIAEVADPDYADYREAA